VRDLVEPVPNAQLSANNGGVQAGVRALEPVPSVRLTRPAAPLPEAYEHAVALWGYLCRQYPGDTLAAGEVEAIAYSEMLAAYGWQARPWGGRQGVGKYLGELAGGRRSVRVDGERVRVYFVPRA
jgi:hypothetical protein